VVLVAFGGFRFVVFLGFDSCGFVFVVEGCWSCFLWVVCFVVLLFAFEGFGLGWEEEFCYCFAFFVAACGFEDWLGSAS
jgi:hypothetical protein